MIPKNALIMQTGLIGDCILSLPLAAWLKEALHVEAVDLLANEHYAGWMRGRTIFRDVYSALPYQLHQLHDQFVHLQPVVMNQLNADLKKYDHVLAFLYRIGSTFHQNLNNLRADSNLPAVIPATFVPPINWDSGIVSWHVEQIRSVLKDDTLPPLLNHPRIMIIASYKDQAAARLLLSEQGLDRAPRLAVIHPGAGVRWKAWHLSNFLCLASGLKDKGYRVLFLLGPAEDEVYGESIKSKLFTKWRYVVSPEFGTLCGLARLSDLYIGNDSGITHLFASTGCRTISIFGVTNPVWYRPYGPEVFVHQASKKSMKEADEVDVWKLLS